jgi:hypothetical protein
VDGEASADAVSKKILAVVALAGAAGITIFGTATNTTSVACEQAKDDTETATRVPKTTLDYLNFDVWTPAIVAREDLMELADEHDDGLEGYPVYTAEQVAENDGTDGKPIWMSYGGVSLL